MNKWFKFESWIVPIAGLIILGGVLAKRGAADQQALADQPHTINIIFTGNLWIDFYPAGPAGTGNLAELSARMQEATAQSPDPLVLDTGSFTGATIMTETSYENSVWSFMKQARYDAINLGRTETWLPPGSLDMTLKRGLAAGVSGFVSALRLEESTYSPVWSPFVEVKRTPVTFLIGGVCDDRELKALKGSSLKASRDDQVRYASNLVSEARRRGAVPVLLGDIGTEAADHLARSVPGLPLIITSSIGQAPGVRQTEGVWIVEGTGPGAVHVASVQIGTSAEQLVVREVRPLRYRRPPSKTSVTFWPDGEPGSISGAVPVLPDVGARVESNEWLKKLNIGADRYEIALLDRSVLKGLPMANEQAWYYSFRKPGLEVARVVYIRHQLPHPYPAILMYVLASPQGIIQRVYLPFTVSVAGNVLNLDEWAGTLNGADPGRLKTLTVDENLSIFMRIAAADVYWALWALERGAL
ncbi:MAG: hypothetical protein Kow0059_09770 [Candidatus Sumerlaeia bacterium]